MLEKYLWCEKWRPKTFDDYVFKNDQVKNVVKKWIQEREIPHLFLYGSAGTGKSSLINVLLNCCKIRPKMEKNQYIFFLLLPLLKFQKILR